MAKSQAKVINTFMELFGQSSEIILMIMAVGFIFCVLIMLRVIMDILGCSLKCFVDKLKRLWK